MADNERSATIYTVTDEKLNITFFVGETIEDLCIKICKLLKISPVARYLFALRNYSSKLWLPYGHKLKGRDKNKFDFRMRFKPRSIQKLKQIDEQAYDYYFQQVRADIMNNRVPDIVYEKHKEELIGLGVSDMYRVMLEKNLPRETVESEYKKYIPKECIKRHAFFVKKPIYNALAGISKEHLDASYVKEQYLQQFERMAPNYLYEEYKAIMKQGVSNNKDSNSKEDSNPPVEVLVRINREEIKYYETINDWKTLCTIEDLCLISIIQNNIVQISRKNGVPSCLEFMEHTNEMLMSFISLLDGYYRLSIKWTFNLCNDVTTPTLDRLHKLRCHGPVGKEFSCAKLKEKHANKPGTYLLRESETEYGVYYIDFCNKAGKVQSQRVEQIGSNEFLLSDSCSQSYRSLGHLISSFQDPANSLYLEYCSPPSEYDISPLLICASENITSELVAAEEIIAPLLEGGPRCVSRNQLQINRMFCKRNKNFTPTTSATSVYLATWQFAKGKEHKIALRILKNNSYTEEFLELVDKWGKLKSDSLIRLYGIIVAPSIGMLCEFGKLGPLDEYLRNNSEIIETADMVEAAACLSTALWHLEENRVVHGKIRCAGVFVHIHIKKVSFIVKLGDPGLFTYTENDIPWIPPECYANLTFAKTSFQADMWALATTMWEIFSRGSSIPIYPNADTVKKFYQNGNHLPQPTDCPSKIYELMLECWSEKNTRKQPHAIMRDTNDILFREYKVRPHTYTHLTFPPTMSLPPSISTIANGDKNNDSNDLEERRLNNESHMNNLATDRINLIWDDHNDIAKRQVYNDQNSTNTKTCQDMEDISLYFHQICKTMMTNCVRISDGSGGSHINRDINDDIEKNFLGEMEENGEWHVFKRERIGQGFYGEVFKGIRTNARNNEVQEIAIKMLKTQTNDFERTNQNDFEREIEIMKTLKHPNIVEILGSILDPEKCLIMEFVKHGSLQQYLNAHKSTLTSKRLLSFSLDIATGMDYLGSKNIVHRDLAARNILVASETRVKISDFGLAQKKGTNDYYYMQTPRDLPMKWYAPESLIDGKFSSRSDVWSFGVTMYEIFSLGKDPNLPQTDLDKNTMEKRDDTDKTIFITLVAPLQRGIRLPCPPKCPQEVYRHLMYPCWNLESHKRPSFATLCRSIEELLNKY